MDATLVLVQPI